ncbi:hypothetical protein ABK040_011805 [Willaertia magna]
MNLAGLSLLKRGIVLNNIDRFKLNIINIQETHWSSENGFHKVQLLQRFIGQCSVYNSFKKDKYSGILSIVKLNKSWKVVQFVELIEGRLTNLILNHSVFGVINVVNWYGVLDVNHEDFRISFEKLNELILHTSLHKEKLVIAGDLNMTSISNIKSSLNTQDKILIEWINNHHLHDLLPPMVQPSFRQFNGLFVYAKSRPDHIISNWSDNFMCWDFNIQHQHKGIAVEIPFSINQSLPWNSNLIKKVICPKTLKHNKSTINKIIQRGETQDFNILLSNFKAVIEKFGRIVNYKNAPITRDKRYRDIFSIYKKLIKEFKTRRFTQDWQQFNQWNARNLEDAIKKCKLDMKNILLTILKERKDAFIKKINNLQTKHPFSFVFQKECLDVSIEALCTNNNETEFPIRSHFNNMFNTLLGDSELDLSLIKNKLPDNWNFEEVSGKEVKYFIKKLKNSMQGIDNISVQLLKSMKTSSCQLLANHFNLWIKGLNIPSELKMGILLPLPKVAKPQSFKDFRPIVVLPVIYRLFSTIINSQLMEVCESNNLIHNCQRGFRRKASTLDQLIIVRTVTSHYIQLKKQFFITILDIKNAYGSVLFSKFKDILNSINMNDSNNEAIMNMLLGHNIKVLVKGKLSNHFDSSLGVPQGDPSSPLLPVQGYDI